MNEPAERRFEGEVHAGASQPVELGEEEAARGECGSSGRRGRGRWQ
jgi:hypothetical protein